MRKILLLHFVVFNPKVFGVKYKISKILIFMIINEIQMCIRRLVVSNQCMQYVQKKGKVLVYEYHRIGLFIVLARGE